MMLQVQLWMKLKTIKFLLSHEPPSLFASTLPKPHKPALESKLCQRACKANPFNAFKGGLRIAHAQKNKINLCFVDIAVEINKKYES